MAGDAASKYATYEDLLSLPENVTGQIVDGVLYTQPRPAFRHQRGTTQLASKLSERFDSDGHGPPEWFIFTEPEVHFGRHVLVPDIAGWRRSTMPEWPDEAYTSICPDWVCEALSPSTAKFDRIQKLPIYFEFGVSHVWILDPTEHTVEIFKHARGGYQLIGTHKDDDRLQAEPFDALTIDLSKLWARK